MMDSIPAKTRTTNWFPIAFGSNTVSTQEIRAFQIQFDVYLSISHTILAF